MPERYYLPKTLETWRWPRRINLHHNEVNAETNAWIKSCNAFTPEAQEACYRCSFSKSSYVRLYQVHILTAARPPPISCVPVSEQGQVSELDTQHTQLIFDA